MPTYTILYRCLLSRPLVTSKYSHHCVCGLVQPASINQRTSLTRLYSQNRKPWQATYCHGRSSVATIVALSATFVTYLVLRDRSQNNRLSLQTWTKLKVEAVEHLPDGETKIITIECPLDLLPEPSSSNGRIWIDTVYVKQPDLQIQRPYTPLERIPTSSDGNAVTIRLLVKAYRDGEVGRYIHSLKPGSTIELRGPERSWEADPKYTCDEMIFLAGGTGITPFMQLMHTLQSTSSERDRFPKLTLVQMARTPELLYFNDQVKRWAASIPDKFRLYQVCHQSASHLAKQGRGLKELEEWIGNGQKQGKVVLVCGPESMVASISGPKGRDGISQGLLRGHLKTLGYSENQVWKM